MRKLLTLSLAVASAIVVVGCGPKDDPAAIKPPAPAADGGGSAATKGGPTDASSSGVETVKVGQPGTR